MDYSGQGLSRIKSSQPCTIASQIKGLSPGPAYLRDTTRQAPTSKERQLEFNALSKIPYSSSCEAFLPEPIRAPTVPDFRSGKYRIIQSGSCEDCTRVRRRNVPIRSFNAGMDPEDGYDCGIETKYSQNYRRQNISFYDSYSDSDSEDTVTDWASDDRRQKILNRCM